MKLLDSQLHGVANREYSGFREPNCTTIDCDQQGCGGDNWRWYCQYLLHSKCFRNGALDRMMVLIRSASHWNSVLHCFDC